MSETGSPSEISDLEHPDTRHRESTHRDQEVGASRRPYSESLQVYPSPVLSAYISPQGSATTTPLLLGSPSDTSLLALFRSPALSHTHYPSPAHTLFDTPEHAELELANSWQSPFSGSDILSGAVSQTGQNAQTSAPGQLKRPYSSPNISDGQATKRRLNAVGIASGIGPEAVGGGTGFELAGVNVGRGQLKRLIHLWAWDTRPPMACRRCKTRKLKCEVRDNEDICRRCMHDGHDCDRRPGRGTGHPPSDRAFADRALEAHASGPWPSPSLEDFDFSDVPYIENLEFGENNGDDSTTSRAEGVPLHLIGVTLPQLISGDLGIRSGNREEQGGPSEVLGDHVPFTLGSRHMAGYIATMSAERQEGFEVETAQIHARLELQRSRRSRLAEVDPGGITSDPFTYKDFSNQVFEREGFPFHENCSIGYFIEGGETQAKVFIEVLRVDQKDEVKRYLIQKAPNWQLLKHINILEFLGLSFDSWQSGDPAIIYPYCFNGTLSHYGRHAELDMRLFMIKGVSEGLGYLHEMRVVHGGLQPSRIYVHNDGHPVISGFGYPEVLAMVEDNSLHRPQEERCYQAIELVIEDGVHPNKASDVCAFALTAYEIWTGMQPFEDGVRELELLSSRDGKETTPRYPSPEPSGTGPLWRLFEDCWGPDPDERLTMKEVMARLMDIRDPSGKGKSKQVDDYDRSGW